MLIGEIELLLIKVGGFNRRPYRLVLRVSVIGLLTSVAEDV